MTSCSACNVELRPTAKFCDECGAAVSKVSKPAEYKQVTVLFADVVHSMDIATAVGPERLREIMTELVECATTVVTRYGGTVNQFTGDGLTAVFGAPLALEDHALRACLAALGIQEEAKRVASDVQRRNALALQLRIGLNSGAVIAGNRHWGFGLHRNRGPGRYGPADGVRRSGRWGDAERFDGSTCREQRRTRGRGTGAHQEH